MPQDSVAWTRIFSDSLHADKFQEKLKKINVDKIENWWSKSGLVKKKQDVTSWMFWLEIKLFLNVGV